MPVPEEAGADDPTPIPRRLQRLGTMVDSARRGSANRDVRKIMQLLGMLAIGCGFVCIVFGWYGAAHSPYLYQEIPYVISGGVLVRCAWTLRQVEEDRRNALAIVRSVDRLERLLRTFGEDLRTDDADQEDHTS
jgi:hypothetical protein